MRHSIALKIFALAAGIIALTVVAAVSTNIEVLGLGADIDMVAKRSLPFAVQTARLNEIGLVRRIEFERLYREYGEPQPDPEVIADAARRFDEYTAKFRQRLRETDAGLQSLSDVPMMEQLGIQAHELLGRVDSVFNATTELARATLAARKAGDRDRARELLAFTFKGQRESRELRSRLQQVAANMAAAAVDEAAVRGMRVRLTSGATTILAAVLGLGVAWLISRNLARPVVQLLRSTRAVQAGDLSVHVGKVSEDEIGQLAESFDAMVAELRRKADLQKAFGSYVDPRIVEEVIRPGRPEEMAGQKRVMTVLFADLVGFTSIGEHLTPGGLVRLVNRYFSLMSECVRAENGIIDKFIGDAIMAYWGPPFVREDDQAAAACRAALRQVEALARFQAELPDLLGIRKNVPPVDMRVGIATGEVVVGNIGNDTARSYTVIGDAANLASRLESANTVYGTRILISGETKRMAGPDMETREIDRLAVKGKVEPVEIFELLGANGAVGGEDATRRTQFEQALTAYRAQDWTAAESIFRALAETRGDRPARAFLERIALLRLQSPGADWDGVWRLSTK